MYLASEIATGSAMEQSNSEQRERFETVYSDENRERWAFHYTQDPLVRYLRDRRLRCALQHLSTVLDMSAEEVHQWRVLIVCGGVGGEGTFLANQGFRDVTVSDFSQKSLHLCRRFDERLQTSFQDAENLGLESDSYDLVLVQDGLHHLPRPVLGFTEMLRVSRKAVVVIEPHLSAVGKLLGTEWETSHGEVNYVFRWNQSILEQATRSYLRSERTYVKAIRLWDHNVQVRKVVRKVPPKYRLRAAKMIYQLLAVLLPGMGNMMVGVIVKDDIPS